MNIHELRVQYESSWQKSYPHFTWLIQQHGFESGIEIGVGFGGHAEHMLEHTRLVELVGIDPYEHLDGYEDTMNLSNEAFENLFWYAVGRLSRFGSRFGHLRATSAQAATLINEQADFVYIDGNHTRDGVALDLAIWTPKVRAGGIVGGHHYGCPKRPGVKEAVDAFASARGLKLHVETGELWWAQLPSA